MKKKGRSKKWIVLLLVLVLAAGGAYVYKSKMSGEKSSPLLANVYPQQVVRGNISITTDGSGYIEAAEEKTVSADNTLTIDHVVAETGDQIMAGDVIATVTEASVDAQITALSSTLSDINSAISTMDKSGSSSLTSPISGRVKRIFVKNGDVLSEVSSEKGGIMELSADEKLKVCFKSTRELKLGEEVRVLFLNYDVEGTVLKKDADGTYTVTLLDHADYHVDTEVTIEKDGILVGSGVLEINHPYLVDATYGIADDVRVSTGNWVDKGSTLLTRTMTGYNRNYTDLLERRQETIEDLQKMRDLKNHLEIVSEESGILSGISLMDDTPVQEGAPMYHVIATDNFWLKAEIDELDIVDVAVGQSAKIVFDAFEEEEYEGRVEKISALGTNTGGVTRYTVTIAVPGIEKVKMGMSATATIVIEEHQDVLIIPVDAISMVDGHKSVTVLNGEESVEVPVTLGLVNNTQAEVLEGLSEDDTVLIKGKSDLERMMDLMTSGRRNGRSMGGDR